MFLLVAAMVLIVGGGILRLDPVMPRWLRAAVMILVGTAVAGGVIYALALR